MGQMSEEQKKDLKFKVVAGTFILIVGGTLLAIGPLLPKVMENTRKHKTEANAPARYYYIGLIYTYTFRKEQAKKVFDEFWLLYGDDTTNESLDWEAVAVDSAFKEDEPYYMPWIVRTMNEKDPPEDRPAPVRTGAKERELLGKVLAIQAKYFKDKRSYYESDHLYSCLNSLWPAGSEAQKIGADGIKNKKMRSF